MYKKAGIVIAILLVAGGILAIGLTSCQGGDGIKVNNLNDSSVVESGSEANSNDSNGGSEQSDQPNQPNVPEQSEQTESTIQSAPDQNQIVSTTSEPQSTLTSEERSLLDELSDFKENSDGSDGDTESSDTSEDDYSEKFIEVDKDSIKYDNSDKTIYGVVKGSKIYYSNNALYTAIDILGEDGNTYTYFVPQSTYETLEKGIKLKLSVRMYYADGVSISQVLGVEMA